MRDVLYVSKAVEPPWNDSSKNLVRDVAWGLTRYRPRIMVSSGGAELPPGGHGEPIYRQTRGAFAPALATQVRVMGRLVMGAKVPLWHFFFAPNKRSSAAARWAARLRGVPTVQTVCSAPHEASDIPSLLFADRTVVLSQHTRQRFIEAGVPSSKLSVIPPGIAPLSPAGHEKRLSIRRELGLPEDHALVLYPGDLEFGGGAQLAVRMASDLPANTSLVMACRTKTPAAEAAKDKLQAEVSERGLQTRVFWLGETPRIHDLITSVDVVILPTQSLFAKMDYPLVLLEAMSAGLPVVVTEGTASAELKSYGALVADFSVAGVSESVFGLLGDSTLRERHGRIGREAVSDVFGRAALAQAYERLYDELLGG